MSPNGEKTNLHTLPAELLRWTASFLDSSSALSLATVHPGTQLAAERQLWTSLNISLPAHYGQHPWDESLPYPISFYPSLTRQYAIRQRIQGIFQVLQSDPAKRSLVKDLFLEISATCAPGTVDLLVSVSDQLETLSLCPREEEPNPPGRMSKKPTWVEAFPQPFHDMLFMQDFQLDKLTTLTLKHKGEMYLVNLQRILVRCPNLVNLTIKGGHKGRHSPLVDTLPPLPKLETLYIRGNRIEPLEFIDDILSMPNKLRELTLVDQAHVSLDRRSNSSYLLPDSLPMDVITHRLRACATLKSLSWKFAGWSVFDAINIDESMEGPFANVETMDMKNMIWTAPMCRLEFIQIPRLPNLRELRLLRSNLPDSATRSGSIHRRFQTAPHNSPDGHLPRILDAIRQAPRLEKIHLPNFDTTKTEAKKKLSSHGGFCGVLIRSYTHPSFGELILARLHTRSREFVEDKSVLRATPRSSNPNAAQGPPAQIVLPPNTLARNSPPLVQHLIALGVPASAAQYAPVPRWLALRANSMAYSPSVSSAIAAANYGTGGGSSRPITFGSNGPYSTPTPHQHSQYVSHTAALSIGAGPNALPSSPTQQAPSDGPAQAASVSANHDSQPVETAPNLKNDEQPITDNAPVQDVIMTSDEVTTQEAPANITPSGPPALAASTAVHPAPIATPPNNPTATPTAALPMPPPISDEPTVPSRPISPPPVSSISKLWIQLLDSVPPPTHGPHNGMNNGPIVNPHASAMAAVAALNAQAQAQTGNTEQTIPATEASSSDSAAPSTEVSIPAANSDLTLPSLSEVPADPAAPSAPVALASPSSPTFEEVAPKILKRLPKLQPLSEREFPPKSSYVLTTSGSVPSNTSVVFNTDSARLYYTPPDYPLPPFIPPDRSYDRQPPTVRSFVAHQWHWEDYAMYNGRLMGGDALAKWREAAGVEEDWKEPGRGLAMSDEAWAVLKVWEEGQEVEWEERRVEMLERRRAERAEEMATLGREVKGKGKATPPAPGPSEVATSGMTITETSRMDTSRPGQRPNSPDQPASEAERAGLVHAPAEVADCSMKTLEEEEREEEVRLRAQRRWIEVTAGSLDEPGPSRYQSPEKVGLAM